MKKCCSVKNELRIGKFLDEREITMSIELEVSEELSPILSNFLEDSGFIETEDSSVESEWKSPIYNDYWLLKQVLQEIDFYMQRGGIGWEKLMFNDTTGAHISSSCNGLKMVALRKHYIDLFHPLYVWLVDNPEACEKIYGRKPNQYARLAKNPSNVILSKNNYINVMHDNWIEFRLPKIRDISQYCVVLDLVCNMMEILHDDFFSKLDDKRNIKKNIKNCSIKFVELHRILLERYYI